MHVRIARCLKFEAKVGIVAVVAARRPNDEERPEVSPRIFMVEV